MEITDLNVGDTAYVINGRQNAVFVGQVRAIIGQHIHVQLADKDTLHVFDLSTGKAPHGSFDAELATLSDWRVKVLTDRRRFKDAYRKMQEAVLAFNRDPSADNGYALMDTANEWHVVTLLLDNNAIRANSIPEYLELTA